MLAVENEAQRQYVNDDTVEGATVLMNKIGFLIDDKIQKIEQSQDKKPDTIAKNKKTLE